MNNRYLAPAPSVDHESGLSWPEHRALPVFASPASKLDAFCAGNLDPDEKLLFACLEGLVNRVKPRLFLIPERCDEGPRAWPELLELTLDEWAPEDKWNLVKKYRSAFSGFVLYSTEKTEHTVNLATTYAGLDGLLPVSADLYGRIRALFPDVPVKEDLTALPFDNPVELYRYAYRTCWKRCSRRLIVSAAPRMRHFNRDLAVACGAMVIWTENRQRAEKAVYSRFLAELEPGNALATGWYTEERSGIGAAAEFGLSTVPSDFFENATVYAGMPHRIDVPAVPKMPELENKIYIAVYLSDGDNVQYNEHAMLNLWRNPERGSCPINWTVSPALADFAPGMMNYYYRTATPNDCFVSGPSGLGYSLLIDRHNRRWNLTDRDRMKAYASLTERYLNRTGIHSITVWDEAEEMHAEVYAEVCRNLWGATMVEWNMGPKKLETLVSRDTAFLPNDPGYTPKIEEIAKVFRKKIGSWDRQSPLFLSAQGVSWNMTPANLRELAKMLEEDAPGLVEFVRADHFFCLYNRAHGMAYCLNLLPGFTDGGNTADLGGEYTVTRARIEIADSEGFTLYGSSDGEHWETLETTAFGEDVYDFDLSAENVRRLKVVPAGVGALVRAEYFGK